MKYCRKIGRKVNRKRGRKYFEISFCKRIDHRARLAAGAAVAKNDAANRKV